MRIWLVFVAVVMLFVVACSGSASTPTNSPLTTEGAIGMVQTKIQGMCSPDSNYIKKPEYTALAQLDGGVQVLYKHVEHPPGPTGGQPWHSFEGFWRVHPGTHVIQTIEFEDSHC